MQSGKDSFGFLPNFNELTTLRVKRNLARSVRLEDLVKIKGMSECLGKGVSGTVWKVRDTSVDETLALKEMAIDTIDENKNQVSCNIERAQLANRMPCVLSVMVVEGFPLAHHSDAE